MIKTVLIGLVLGVTLGISVATELFDRIGMQPETYLLTIGGVLFAILLINRSMAVLAAAGMLSIAVLQPKQVLLEYGFDKDILLAALLVTLLYPVVYKVMHS